MKKLLQVLCSIFFATSMSVPADALANPVEDLKDDNEERVAYPSASDNYHLSLVMGDFGLLQTRMATARYADPPMIFVSDPTGKIVKDAQVVTTIIDPNGGQTMCRALPIRSGYLVPTNHLLPGRYLLEAEIVTNGWLLTDVFSFVKT